MRHRVVIKCEKLRFLALYAVSDQLRELRIHLDYDIGKIQAVRARVFRKFLRLDSAVPCEKLAELRYKFQPVPKSLGITFAVSDAPAAAAFKRMFADSVYFDAARRFHTFGNTVERVGKRAERLAELCYSLLICGAALRLIGGKAEITHVAYALIFDGSEGDNEHRRAKERRHEKRKSRKSADIGTPKRGHRKRKARRRIFGASAHNEARYGGENERGRPCGIYRKSRGKTRGGGCNGIFSASEVKNGGAGEKNGCVRAEKFGIFKRHHGDKRKSDGKNSAHRLSDARLRLRAAARKNERENGRGDHAEHRRKEVIEPISARAHRI